MGLGDVDGLSETLEALGRALRDPQPNVWQEASRTLGSLAASSYVAFEELQRLATCPHGELRLRGMHALVHLAPERPEETRALVFELLDGFSDDDAVFADALLAVVASLPPHQASHIIEDLVDDPREVVRAATAGALVRFRGWRGGLLHDFARDPSDQVRCTLALSLVALADVHETAEALQLLAASPEPHVRAFVAEVTSGETPPREQPIPQGSPAILPILRPGSFDPRVAAARIAPHLAQQECHRAAVEQVEELLAMHPRHAAETLAPLLSLPGTPSLLDQLSWTAREPVVSTLCRSLLPAIIPGSEMPAHHLRHLHEMLESQQGAHAGALRVWVAECVGGAGAADLDQIVGWAETVDPSRYAVLVEVAAALQACTDLAALVAVHASLPDVLSRIESDYPLPERRFVRTVAECWGDVIDQAFEELVSEVES